MCRECIIDKLEGTGFRECECPVCKLPLSGRKDLCYDEQIATLVDAVRPLCSGHRELDVRAGADPMHCGKGGSDSAAIARAVGVHDAPPVAPPAAPAQLREVSPAPPAAKAAQCVAARRGAGVPQHAGTEHGPCSTAATESVALAGDTARYTPAASTVQGRVQEAANAKQAQKRSASASGRSTSMPAEAHSRKAKQARRSTNDASVAAQACRTTGSTEAGTHAQPVLAAPAPVLSRAQSPAGLSARTLPAEPSSLRANCQDGPRTGRKSAPSGAGKRVSAKQPPPKFASAPSTAATSCALADAAQRAREAGRGTSAAQRGALAEGKAQGRCAASRGIATGWSSPCCCA